MFLFIVTDSACIMEVHSWDGSKRYLIEDWGLASILSSLICFFLSATVVIVVVAVPFVDAASVEGLAVRDIVAAAIFAHPAVTAGSGGSTPEGLVLGLIAPGASLGGGSTLDNSRAEQESSEEDQRLVHGWTRFDLVDNQR